MFTLLESTEDIAAAQRRLTLTVRKALAANDVRNIGYPGGTNYDAKIRTDGALWYWSGDHEGEKPSLARALNWFGLHTPTGGLQITVEINTPRTGRKDMVAGFFARNVETRRVYLFHSGRVGGGTKGVGRTALLAWSNFPLVDVIDSSGKPRQGIMVMPIEGDDAIRPAMRFVKTIAEFKIAVRNKELDTPAFKRKMEAMGDYYAESRGRRQGKRSQIIDYISRHGDVVEAVKKWRADRGLSKVCRIVKNVGIDLGVESQRHLAEVYEVKTSCSRDDIYKAIGQVMTHGRNAPCSRFVILPHDQSIKADLREAMELLKIEVLRFGMDKKTAWII